MDPDLRLSDPDHAGPNISRSGVDSDPAGSENMDLEHHNMFASYSLSFLF